VFLPARAGAVIDPSKALAEEGTETLWYDLAAARRRRDAGGRKRSLFTDRLPGQGPRESCASPSGTLSRQSAGLCARFVTDATSIQGPMDPDPAPIWRCRTCPANGGERGSISTSNTRAAGDGLAIGFPKGTDDGASPWPAPCRLANASFSSICHSINGGHFRRARSSPGVQTRESRSVRARGPSQTDRLLWHVDHAGEAVASRSRDGPHRNPATAARVPGHQPRLFSGNGRMEPEMATLFAELDPSVYVSRLSPQT